MGENYLNEKNALYIEQSLYSNSNPISTVRFHSVANNPARSRVVFILHLQIERVFGI